MDDLYPLVTVYIPTFNRRKFLERALISVITQTYKNIEVIVVDDGSTDDTEVFMQAFMLKYTNVRYLKHDTPEGANAARNYAIREARGYFVTGLDDDDEFLPERIEKLVEAYDDKYAYIFSKWYIINKENTKQTQKYIFDTITLNDMLNKNITGNQVLAKKELFLACSLFDETLPSAQDYDMWIRMLCKIPIAKMIAQPLYNMYVTPHQRISTSKKQLEGYLKCYNKHKHLMRKEHRKESLIQFRSVKEKKITSLKMIRRLYPKHKWLRMYLGYGKRKLF